MYSPSLSFYSFWYCWESYCMCSEIPISFGFAMEFSFRNFWYCDAWCPFAYHLPSHGHLHSCHSYKGSIFSTALPDDHFHVILRPWSPAQLPQHCAVILDDACCISSSCYGHLHSCHSYQGRIFSSAMPDDHFPFTSSSRLWSPSQLPHLSK